MIKKLTAKTVGEDPVGCQRWKSMYVYTNEDFGSSGFTEIASITIHLTVFQYITIHRHQKMVDRHITTSQEAVSRTLPRRSLLVFHHTPTPDQAG